MRKRTNSEEDSEMEVGEEERKVEVEDFDSEDDEMKDVDEDGADVVAEKTGPTVDNTFMDSFYGLSDADPKERARAAQAMLQHCLLGPNANTKDAAYTFRRLLNGLCSGRAAARQGNASALASFLRIAFHLEKMSEIQNEADTNPAESPSSPLKYVRSRLIAATDASRTDGKKKGSEERDYQFGRLFGILGFVRSGILLLPTNEDEVKDVASLLIADLVDLFWLKKWMREPAAHGVTALLDLFFVSSTKSSKKIGLYLVKDVVIPKILMIAQDDRSEERDFETLLKKYTPEQVGIAAHIQARSQKSRLPYPLDQSIVSSATLPLIASALSETSVIVQPRTHFVWDSLWCYLTEKIDDSSSTKDEKKILASKYKFRSRIPGGEDSVNSVIESIMGEVVKEKLLKIEKGKAVAKTTHERLSLALCIVRNLSGASFLSTISGPTQIEGGADMIENIILTPEIIKSLFLNVICAGHNKADSAHTLKPLSLEVLRSLVESAAQSGDQARQLAFLKVISNCDPRFDSRTKTRTISGLFSSAIDGTNNGPSTQTDLWKKYLAHLEARFLELCGSSTDSSAEATGYIELLYAFGKQLVHLKNGSGAKNEDIEFNKLKQEMVKQVLGFFMATAFFDCSSLAASKRKDSLVLKCAFKLQQNSKGGRTIPHFIRAVVGTRFFALVSELALTASREVSDEATTKLERDFNVLVVLEELCRSWNELELTNAKRYGPQKDEDDDESPEKIIKELLEKVHNCRQEVEKKGNDPNQSKKRCVTGITVLALTLQLHRLSCGSDDDEMDDDPDADEEEDEENICNAIEELKAIASDFIEGNESESNPLLGLGEVCANILSSPLGSGDIGRGAAPRLVREAIRCAWLGGLNLASTSATKEKTLLDDTVVGLLMDAIGAPTNTIMSDKGEEDDADADGDSDDESGDESEEESENDDMVFSMASKVFEDPENMKDAESVTSDKNGDESDIELDPIKLHTMLEDENLDDIEDIPLEHHEGADAALAKLIKMKQDARKAGKDAREKIQLSNQLRCTYLIELVLTNPDLWSNLFQVNTIIDMVIPLLTHRKAIGRSAQKAMDKGGELATERKKLLIRLTTIISQKLCKIRLSSMPLSSPVDTQKATETIQHVMTEAKNSKEKEFLGCCSRSLIFLFRLMPVTKELTALASTEYGNIVSEWSTKRNSGASLVEDLILHMPALAQASILGPLIDATQKARVPILKVEAYRLLSQLFGNKPNADDATDMDMIALSSIEEGQNDLLQAIHTTLQDEDMATPKRARGVLVVIEKMMSLLSCPATHETVNLMSKTKNDIVGLGEKHTGLSALVTKVSAQIDGKIETFKEKAQAAPSVAKSEAIVTSSSSKKSKKKKKKKKR